MNKENCVALYIRISVEDEDNHENGKDESNSVGNQKDLLYRYLSGKPEFKGSRVIELCDDGYSGTNFRRPAMTELLEKAKAKEINCVIVKDFSRFGREYIVVSDYIDQIFPFLGIRFISVNDGYDSALANGATSGVDVAFRNIIYGYYSRDLSEKVKSAKRTKALKGDYLSPYAPIGYRKAENDKNKLVIDEESAVVVKRIFRMAGMGMKIAQIAKILNAENVPTPRESKNKQGIYHPWPAVSDYYLWYESIVGRILRDERYLGKVVYGKRYRPEVGSRKTLKSGKANWIVVEEKHEPLVSLEDFMAAQAAMAEFVEVDTPGYGNHLLSGKMKCGVCGYSLARTKKPTPRYSCETKYKAKACGCMRGHIKESELAEIVLYAIRAYALVMLDAEKMAKTAGWKHEPLNLRKQIAEYQTAVKKMEEQRAALYDDYAEERIDRESFIKGRDRLTLRQEEMESCTKALQSELTKAEAITDPGRPQESRLKQYLKADTLTRKMVVELVDNICVYTDHSIKINWRFD